MRTVGVVTVARSDYGISTPVLRRIVGDPELKLHLVVTGMHLSPEFGLTVRDIERDGLEIGDRVEMLLSSDSPEAIAKSMGLGTIGFAQSYARMRPDLLLVLGDRFEMHAAVVASLPFGIPVAHIHGGESTEGAFDEPIRHSITKMSHLHFTSTEEHARRVVQMGEAPWRVTVSGAPSLDNLYDSDLLGREQLERTYNLDLSEPPLLVTYHPVTLEYEKTEHQVDELLAALGDSGHGVVFTFPNADTHGRRIIPLLHEFVAAHPRCRLVANLGVQGYFSLMSYSAAMVGNSSSGMIEAASFKLPVVNIGNRQRGRARARNVVDVCYGRGEIVDGIRRATSPEFRAALSGLVNPYGDGHAADRIVSRIRSVALDATLLQKRFHEVERATLCV